MTPVTHSRGRDSWTPRQYRHTARQLGPLVDSGRPGLVASVLAGLRRR